MKIPSSKDYLAKTKPALKKLKQVMIKHDLDYLMCVTGYERCGKSTLALHIALEMDEDFDIEKQLCYDIKSLFKAVYTAKPGQCIIADEGAVLAMARESMTSDNREFVRLLSVMGAQNVMLLICIPQFSLIDSYVRNHRVCGLAKVVSRGKFKFYNKKALKNVFFNPKVNAWVFPNPSFVDFFGSLEGAVWERYKRKKENYLIGRKKDWLIDDDKKDTLYSELEFAKKVGVHKNTVFRKRKAGIITGHKNPSGHWRYTEEELERVRREGW